MKFILIALLAGACLTVTWPTVSKTVTLSAPITVKAGQTYDGFKEYSNKWVRFERGKSGLGDCTSVEGGKADACFLLYKGATLKNVVLGAKSIEHVHCEEDGCTVENVYWEDVCEDALTFENGSSTSAKYYVKEVLLKMEVIKLFNSILLVLFIFLISIVKILENSSELVEIVNQDIKEKELLI